MNRTIGVMAGLLLALGASACVTDPSLEFAADPNQIAVDPDAMFMTYGVQKQALVRYVDDRNRATPAKYEITNVGPGITVTLDTEYRKDVIGSDDLSFREVQLQHRYFINTTEAAAAGIQTSFTLSTGGVSKTVPVRVIPANLGAAVGSATPALGEPVTINAPANLSFTDGSTVTFTPGGAAVIVEQTAKAITILPRPGSEGAATVTNVVMDYAPTVSPRTLVSTNTISVPAVTSAPVSFSATTALTPVTMTVPGFVLGSNVSVSVGGMLARVVSVAADGSSAQVILPAGQSGAPVVSNLTLSFLPSVNLTNLPAVASITTATTPWNGSAPDGNAPVINAAAPGTAVVLYDTWINTTNGDEGYWGGPSKWYKLVLPSGGSRTYTVQWNSGADLDFMVADGPTVGDEVNGRYTGSNPEVLTLDLPAGTYWISLGSWNNLGQPGVVSITVQ